MDTEKSKEFHLEKTAKTGPKASGAQATGPKIQVWHATIKTINSDGHIIMEWTWGQQNGKMQVRNRTYTKGLVKRSAWDQALQDCTKMVNDKIDKGYVLISGDLGQIEQPDDKKSKVPKDSNNSVPYVMLAFDSNNYPEMMNRCGFIMPKLDGIFCMANLRTGELWSRTRKQFTSLKHIEDAVRSIGQQDQKRRHDDDAYIKKSFPTSVRIFSSPTEENDYLNDLWIVGELYVHGLGFQTISGLVRHKTPRPEQLQIQFHVFDAILPNNFQFRRNVLSSIFLNIDNVPESITLVPCKFVYNIKESCDSYHTAYANQGYEGIMIHPFTLHVDDDDSECPGYLQNNRTKWLLKYKKFMQEEYICIEVKPQKHNSAIAGSVLLKNNKDQEFSATPDWTNDEKMKLWTNRQDFIGQIATVKFFCYTDKGLPRFPILNGFRHPDDIDCSK